MLTATVATSTVAHGYAGGALLNPGFLIAQLGLLGSGDDEAEEIVETAEPIATTTPELESTVLGANTFKFNQDLRYGMRNQDVYELQERLRSEGHFTYPTSTGFFGPFTFAAVKAYQTANPDIGYVTGFVGPLTRAVLNK